MKGAVLFLLVAGGWPMLLPQAPPGRELHGRIVNMETEPAEGVPYARVKILSIEREAITNRDGEFFLRLPDSVQAGEQVEVTVNAPTAGKQLLLFQPLDRRIRIPAGRDLKKEIIQIGLLPKGSLRFLSDGAIQALLGLANREGQIQAMREQGKASIGQFDLTNFLEQWGKERGIDPSEVAKRVAAWAAEIISQPSADRERQALAAFAQSNFEKAGRLFAEAGDERLRRLKEFRKREEEERRQVVEDYTQSGDADFNGALYQRALMEYQQALAETDRERDPTGWAELKEREGNAYGQLGEIQEGPEAIAALRLAIDDHRQVLRTFTREGHAQDWARTQNNLGNALEAQGERNAGEESVRLLAQAVEAYRNALQIRTREQLPQNWAATQNNLGIALQAQGERSAPEIARPVFMQAVEAFSSALEVYPKSTGTMARLGLILHERLFDFQRALAINRQRVEQLPRDTGASADLIESQFTMGQFAECITRSAQLRGSLGPDQSGTKTFLYVLETSCHLGQGHVSEALALAAELSRQLAPSADSSFPSWTFSGTRHFVEASPALAAYREPLLRLLVAFESRNVASAKQAVEGMSQFLTAELSAK